MPEPKFVVPAHPQVTVPVVGTDAVFPVHRLFCVGRNYAEHTREMGFDPDKEPPFFFLKGPDAINLSGKFGYPVASKDVHWEIELIVAIGKGGRNIKAADALNHIYGYALGLDMTRRDLQGVAKKTGRPWEVGKNYEHSCPMGPIYPVSKVGHLTKGAITLDVNGQRKQTGDLKEMIWDIPHQIEFLSALWTLEAGDLILTGTPSGVGAVKVGDKLHGAVAGLGELNVEVTP
jgi:fumarylpyruvate hydrolase